jgi:hypothetical protein
MSKPTILESVKEKLKETIILYEKERYPLYTGDLMAKHVKANNQALENAGELFIERAVRIFDTYYLDKNAQTKADLLTYSLSNRPIIKERIHITEDLKDKIWSLSCALHGLEENDKRARPSYEMLLKFIEEL